MRVELLILRPRSPHILKSEFWRLMMQRLIFTCALIALFVCGAFAQVNTATVSGAVTDASHAAVPGVKLQLRNDATDAILSAVSNSAGQYTFNFVPVGPYTITVKQTGFQDQVRHGIQLSAGDSLSLDFQLQVGTNRQEVTIQGDTPLIDLASSDQHDTIGKIQVAELPLARQDWTNLLKLGNGVTKAGNQGLSMNGLPPAAFNVTVDGTNASPDAELPSLGFYQGFNVINIISQDAVQEISTTKSIAPATVAGSMSGNVNIISKGGTNTFHGSLFEFNSVAAYNARNQFLAVKPGSTFNQYGGTFGGRIIKDKLFTFTSYEGVRLRNFTALSDDVPTPEFVKSTLAINPVYAPVFAVFPAPNQPYAAGAQTGRFVGAGSGQQDDLNFVQRFDWYITSTNMLNVRYTRSRPERTAPRVIEVNPRITAGHGDVYNWQFTHTSSNWTSNTRFGYNRLYLNRLDAGMGVGLDGVAFGFNTGGAEAFEKRAATQTWEETIGLSRGRHSLQFGGILQRQSPGRTDNNTNSFSYSNLADFLANIPNQIQINFPVSFYQMHTWQVGAFIQDDWRIRPNLTLNLGARYDHWTVPKESNGRVFNRAPTALGPGFGDFLPADQMFKAEWRDFSPRLGFSWALGSDRKTVVRGGTGIFFNPHPIFGGPIELGAPIAPTVPNRLTLNRAQALAAGLKYPVNTTAVLNQLIASGTPISGTTINPNFPNPYSLQWNIGIQRELGHGIALDTAYVGNRGLHLIMVRNLNLPDRLTGVAPNPAFGQFRYYDGSDNSHYNAWQTSVQKRFSSGLSFTGAYTWASNTSWGDNDLQLNAVPQDNNNLAADRGPSPFALRHSFTGSYLYELPFMKLTSSKSRPTELLLAGWQLSGVITATSGLPANVTNSKSSYANSRPDVAAGVSPYLSDSSATLRYLNPAAFITVPLASASGASIRPGNLGRYALNAPGMWTLDATLSKNFNINEKVKFQLRGDFFNAFNHTNLSGLVTDVSKATFGQLTSATSRSVQIGGRLSF
jgi:hypothetical protein